MSKNSNSRKGSEGDMDEQTHSLKRNAFQVLKRVSRSAEGVSKGPRGDYTYADCVSKTIKSETFRAGSSSVSQSSLDNELYGSNDTFNDNLAFLKHKLHIMKIIDSQEGTTSDNIFNSDIIGISNKFEYENIQPAISTIYETSEGSDTDNTISSASYRVPMKKPCYYNDTGGASAKNSHISPSSTDLSLKSHTSANLSVRSLIVSSPSESTFCVADKKLREYRSVINSTSRYLVSSSNAACTPCNERNTNAFQQTATTQTSPHADDLDLRLNLSSNRSENCPTLNSDNCTSTLNSTPLEPNVIIVGPINSSPKKFKPIIKISPFTASVKYQQQSISPCIATRGSNFQSCDTIPKEIVDRYYRDTPEFSSASTPTFIVSSIYSRSSSQATSKMLDGKPVLKTSPKIYHPYLSCSLEVPRRAIYMHNFPPISKITSYSGCYVMEKNSKLYNSTKHMITNCKEESSSMIFANSVQINRSAENISPLSQRNRCRVSAKRNLQYGDAPFYSYSTDDGDASLSSRLNIYPPPETNSPSSDNDFEGNDCCCLKLFFRKRKRNYSY